MRALKDAFATMLGFALGQGTMFLAQSYLVFNGKVELVGKVGVALSAVTLCQWIADAGGIYALNSYVTNSTFRQRYLSFLVARAIVAIPLVVLLLLAAEVVFGLEVSTVAWALGVSCVSLFSVSGALDARRFNTVAGPMSSLGWVLASVVMVVLDDANALTGAVLPAFFVGTAIATAAQNMILSRRTDLLSGLEPPTRRQVLSEVKHMASYTASFAAGQAFGRLLPLALERAAGSNIAGLFLYAKTISNALGQVIIFLRRARFREIVEAAQLNLSVREALAMQRHATLLSVSVAGLMGVSCLVAYHAKGATPIGLQVLFFVLLNNVLWVFSSGVSQLYFAQEKALENAVIVTLSVLAAVPLLLIWLPKYSVWGAVGAEAIMLLFQFVLLAGFFGQTLRHRHG